MPQFLSLNATFAFTFNLTFALSQEHFLARTHFHFYFECHFHFHPLSKDSKQLQGNVLLQWMWTARETKRTGEVAHCVRCDHTLVNINMISITYQIHSCQSWWKIVQVSEDGASVAGSTDWHHSHCRLLLPSFRAGLKRHTDRNIQTYIETHRYKYTDRQT